VKVEGKGLQIGASWLETCDKVGNANPKFIYGLVFELSRNPVGLELRRKTALYLSSGDDKVGFGVHLAQFLQIHCHFPILISAIKSSENEVFL
jgi:hypothetical protein